MRRGQRNYLQQRKLLLGVLTVMGLAMAHGILFGNQGIPRYLELRRAFVERSAKAYQRMERNQALSERLEGLRTSDRVLEEIARVHLGVVEDDEIVYVFRPPDRQALR
jgi:cell division protein FtsB